MGKMVTYKFYLVFAFILIAAVSSAVPSKLIKIIYKLSARNLPADKNAFFAEVQKDKPHYCRTESIKSENPNWIEICEVEFREGENDTRLAIETRHNKSGPDESIGWSVFFVRDMLQNGQQLTEEVRNGGDYRGTMRLTVLLACVPGEPGCGLTENRENQTKPLLNVKVYL